MRGEDRLTGRSGRPVCGALSPAPFRRRPRLPRAEAAPLLRLPGGTVWRLRAVGAEMSLADSVYLGSGEVRPTRQIVLSGTTGRDGATVRWAIRREPVSPDAKAGVPETKEAPAPEAVVPLGPSDTAKPEAAEPEGTPGCEAGNSTKAPEPEQKRKPAEGADGGA